MADPAHIIAWQRLSPMVTTSGALAAADLPVLAALGVRSVINLALADHPQALAGEAEQLGALGIAYTHLPIPFDAPDEAHYIAFVAAYEAAPRPVHVHCILNWRVSAVLYRYHRDVLGMPATEARPLMARQWDPATSDHPAAPAWAALIERPGEAVSRGS